jgi:sugar lactone lactonase YvrE
LKKNPRIDCILDCNADIGEGAIWSSYHEALFWVDIPNGHLCRFDPETNSNKIWEMGKPIGCFALKENDQAIVALSDGFYEFDFQSEKLIFIGDPEMDKPGNRFNDGTTDIKGRFIAGTMPINEYKNTENPQGSLYCLNENRKISTIMSDFFIVNGLTFSPDGTTAYVSDTHKSIQTIWSFDYNIDQAKWSNKQVFFDAHSVSGRPDGGAMDTDSCYWMAGVGGWELIRITPKGQIDLKIKMPIEKPTRIAFGGKNLDTLYVTSIGKNRITQGTQKLQPYAGGLFVLKVPGVQGIALPYFVG